MNEYLEALGELFGLARAGWDYTGPERRRLMDWLRKQSISMQRRFQIFVLRLTIITRCAIVVPFLLIGVAMFCTPHAAHTIIPILVLLPLLLLAWLGTTWLSIAGFAVLAIIPADAGFGIGATIGLFRKIMRLLLLILLGEMIVGIYLSIVPISNDRGLVPLLVVVAIALMVATFAIDKGWTRRILILIAIVITAVFFLGGRDKAETTLEGIGANNRIVTTSPNFHPGLMCLDDAGHRKALHYENVVDADFNSAIPKGCWVEVNMPPHANRFHSQQIGSDHEWQVYFMTSDGKITGSIGWTSDNFVFVFPQKFYMQGVKDGEEIKFYTTDAPAQPKEVKDEAKANVSFTFGNVAWCGATDAHLPNSRGVTRPTFLPRPAPPDDASMWDGFKGQVPACFVVDEQGNATDIRILQPPSPDIEEKMVVAIKKWKFVPGMEDGIPVPIQLEADVTFK